MILEVLKIMSCVAGSIIILLLLAGIVESIIKYFQDRRK